MKKFIIPATVVLLSLSSWAYGSPKESETVIVTSPEATSVEWLAAKELRRYLYLTTGEWLALSNENHLPTQNIILVANHDREVIQEVAANDITSRLAELAEQQYLIKTVDNGHRKVLIISGGDNYGTLYGAYRFLETQGIRFYLHGDVLPDQKRPLVLDNLDITGKPLFELRGIQPFHDFPEGPDWWNRDDYKAYIAQLAKLRMNFIGFHTYPESDFNGYYRAEPMVWIGTQDQIHPGKSLRWANPVWSCPSGFSNPPIPIRPAPGR